MTNPTRLLATAAAALLIAAGCGDDDSTAPTGPDADRGSVTVDEPWARTSPAMATNGAVYMQLTSAVDDRLVGVSVDETIAADAQVHETVADPDSGEMSMQEVDGIDLPSGDAVVLEPGGHHVMLLDLAEPLEPGTEIEVVLELEELGELPVAAEVRDVATDDDGMSDGMDDGMGDG
jgi:periplasmic copper chaperone A